MKGPLTGETERLAAEATRLAATHARLRTATMTAKTERDAAITGLAQAGLTQHQIAGLTGLTQPEISKIIRGLRARPPKP